MVLGVKGLLVGLGIVIAGILLARDQTPTRVAIIAIIATIALMFVVGRMMKNRTTEIFITGIIVGIPEAYVFLIQPNYPGLVELPGSVELFFGVAIATRLIILILELVDNPFQKHIKKVFQPG